MEKGLRMANVFIIGCPACAHNFKHLFCSLFCSPDQAAFTDVTAAQEPFAERNGTCVKEVSFYLDEGFKAALFDSCKDVVYSAANQKAMTYIGNGATDAQEFLEFLGLVKDNKTIPVGSPFQMNFPVLAHAPAIPPHIVPLHDALPACGSPDFRCSCGDCPSAPACKPYPQPPAPPPGVRGCARLGLGATHITCQDVAIWVPGMLLLLALLAAYACRRRHTTLALRASPGALGEFAASSPIVRAYSGVYDAPPELR